MPVVRKEPSVLAPEKPARKTREAKDAAEIVKVTLPVMLTEPATSIGRCLTLIYGERKIGKTSLAAQFGKTLLIATEVGYKGLRVFKMDAASWRELRNIIKALKTDKSFDTVCIDTIDLAYKKCEKHVCRQLGIDDPSEEEWGKGWRAVRAEFEDMLNELAQTGKGVLLLTHAQEQDVKMRSGESYTHVVPTMSKMAREIIEGMVDIWAYYMYDGTRRVLTVQGDDHISAGHRFEERFKTPDGETLRHIDMGMSAKEAYRNFIAAFNNTYVPTHRQDIVSPDEPEDEEDETPAPRKRKKFVVKKTRS